MGAIDVMLVRPLAVLNLNSLRHFSEAWILPRAQASRYHPLTDVQLDPSTERRLKLPNQRQLNRRRPFLSRALPSKKST